MQCLPISVIRATLQTLTNDRYSESYLGRRRSFSRLTAPVSVPNTLSLWVSRSVRWLRAEVHPTICRNLNRRDVCDLCDQYRLSARKSEGAVRCAFRISVSLV